MALRHAAITQLRRHTVRGASEQLSQRLAQEVKRLLRAHPLSRWLWRQQRIGESGLERPLLPYVLAWNAVMETHSLPGDIVEAGVYKGGTSMVMAYASLHLANRNNTGLRHMWMYDTYEGLPEPGKEDGSRAQKRWSDIRSLDTNNFKHGTGYIDASGKKRWNYGPLEMVRQNMLSTGYPMQIVTFVKGKVEDTLQDATQLPQQISVLRLDTDFFASTAKELEVLFPRLVSGGVLLIDDYCHWRGSKAAVDVFLKTHHHMLQNIQSKGNACFRAVKR